MTTAREKADAHWTKAEGTPPEGAPCVGQIYEDTILNPGEWVTILHVGSDAAIVQRRNGVGRYPLPDFCEGKRFRFVDDADSKETSRG